jgi:hypothetical protein
MDMDQAFAASALGRAACRLASQCEEAALRVARNRQDRVRDEARLIALLGQLGQRRIEQERLVVVDDFENRQLPLAALTAETVVAETQIDGFRLPRRNQVVIGGSSGAREHVGRERIEILGDGPSEKQSRKLLRHGAPQSGSCGLDRGNCRCRCIRHPLGHLPPLLFCRSDDIGCAAFQLCRA